MNACGAFCFRGTMLTEVLNSGVDNWALSGVRAGGTCTQTIGRFLPRILARMTPITSALNPRVSQAAIQFQDCLYASAL